MGPVNYSKLLQQQRPATLVQKLVYKSFFFSKFQRKHEQPKVTIPRMMLTMIFELAARYHGPKEKGLAPNSNNHNWSIARGTPNFSIFLQQFDCPDFN